jgi:hypothetical protein
MSYFEDFSWMLDFYPHILEDSINYSIVNLKLSDKSLIKEIESYWDI